MHLHLDLEWSGEHRPPGSRPYELWALLRLTLRSGEPCAPLTAPHLSPEALYTRPTVINLNLARSGPSRCLLLGAYHPGLPLSPLQVRRNERYCLLPVGSVGPGAGGREILLHLLSAPEQPLTAGALVLGDAQARAVRSALASEVVDLRVVVSEDQSLDQETPDGVAHPPPAPEVHSFLHLLAAPTSDYLDSLPTGAVPRAGPLYRRLHTDVSQREPDQALLWAFARAVEWIAALPYGPESDLIVRARMERLLLRHVGPRVVTQELLDGLMNEVVHAMAPASAALVRSDRMPRR